MKRFTVFIVTALVSFGVMAANTNIFDMKDVWGVPTVTYDGIKMVITDTDSADDSKMFNVSVVGGQSFYVGKYGQVDQAAALSDAAANQAAYNLAYTVNKAAGNDTGLQIVKTTVASPGGSNVLDLIVDTTSIFSVNDDGDLSHAGAFITSGPIHPGDTSSFLQLRGGGPSDGSGVQFNGSTNTSPYDISFTLDGVLSALLYDFSLTEWNFQTNDITTSGQFTSAGIDDNATGERIQIGDEATFFGDGSATETYHLGMPATSGNSYLSIGSDDDFLSGATAVFYNSAHTVAGSDVEFYSAGGQTLKYDYSATLWDFKANDVTNSGKLSTTGKLRVYQNGATDADINDTSFELILADKTDWTGLSLVAEDDKNAEVVFGDLSNSWAAGFSYKNGTNGEFFQMWTGGSAGPQIHLHSNLSTTTPNDFVVREGTGGPDSLRFDYSANLWDFQGNAVATGLFTSSGIDDNATGRRILLTDTTMIVGTSATTSVAEIRGAALDGYMELQGGGALSTNDGAHLRLYADSHGTLANDFIFLSDGGVTEFWYDHSNSRLDTQGNKLVLGGGGLHPTTSENNPIWTAGTGTPEGVVTSGVGGLFTRTDGGAGTTLYVKETGTGNTGWVAK